MSRLDIATSTIASLITTQPLWCQFGICILQPHYVGLQAKSSFQPARLGRLSFGSCSASASDSSSIIHLSFSRANPRKAQANKLLIVAQNKQIFSLYEQARINKFTCEHHQAFLGLFAVRDSFCTQLHVFSCAYWTQDWTGIIV